MSWFKSGRYEAKNSENTQYTMPKSGTTRFLQLVKRDLYEYCKANLLCCACFAPAIASGGVCLAGTSNYALSAAAALVFGIPAGGGICGLHRVLNRSVRDISEPTVQVFFQGFRDSFFTAILPGLLFILQLILAFYMLLFHSAINAFPIPGRLWALLIMSWIFLQILLQYCFPILVLLKLPLRHLLRNSLILFFSNPRPSLLCFSITTLLYAASILLFPADAIALLLFGGVLPGLVQQLFSWQPIDTAFSISIRQRNSDTVPLD
jgi:uncharacterized membrane protein YesL